MTTFDPQPLGERAEAMIDALATVTAEPGKITRLYLTREHKQAAELIGEWMRRTDMRVRMDAAGTMHGLWPAAGEGQGTAKRLLIGSHLDTVIDGGRYDGALGVVTGILAVAELQRRGIALPFAVEILAFGDEEGVRFPKTLSSSATIAGTIDDEVLSLTDGSGMTMRAALAAFGADPEHLAAEAYHRGDVVGYLEVHIEQGPVLEQSGQALGLVSAIASQGRYRLTIRGEAGHAGTVPMAVRHDALVAAAEAILAIEEIALKGARSSLVATVGEVKVSPGAGNVIPGHVALSLDIRAANDEARLRAAQEVRGRMHAIGPRRGVAIGMETLHEKPVATCAPWLRQAISTSITGLTGRKPIELMSGAGHDGQAMIHLTDIGMIFVRCRAGISHNPLESVTVADQGYAVEALVHAIVEVGRQYESR